MIHIKDWKFIAETSEAFSINENLIETIERELTEEERLKIKNWYLLKIENDILVFIETEESIFNESMIYAEKRATVYPKIEDYLDAQVKKSSLDPVLIAEGIEQEAKYFADCLAVKELFPKIIS